MRAASGIAVALVCATLGWTSAAQAQGSRAIPQGSYLRSCHVTGMRGDTLIAVCKDMRGAERETELTEVSRCVGDIGNNNGALTCNKAGPPRPENPRGPMPQEPMPPGPPGGPGPRAGGGEWRERCEQVRREVFETRQRLEREANPFDRERLERRLRELHEDEERCRG